MSVDEVGRTAERFLEGGELHRNFRLDHFAIEPPHEATLQHFRQWQEHATVGRPEMHRERAERRSQRHMQADFAAVAPGMAFGDGILQPGDLVALDRGSHHHDGGGVEAMPLDQLADAAVDAGTDPVIVGAQPDAARRVVVHSAAVRSGSLSAALPSARFTLCSATK